MRLELKPRKRSRFAPLVAATIAVLLLVGFDRISDGILRMPLRSLAASVSTAGEGVAARVAGSGFFTTRASLATQNAQLRQELTVLQATISENAALRDESVHLREIAHLAEAARGTTAPIASAIGASRYGTFLVGAGTRDGIATGDIVFSEDGFAIGRISEASEHTALVLELFAPGEKTSVVLAQAQLEAEGKGGGNAHLRAARGLAVSEGDIATAPSLAGVPVGIVGKVESDPASAYADVYLRMPLNLAGLRFVYIKKI